MLSSLLRPLQGSGRQPDGRSPFSSPSPQAPRWDSLNERSHLLPRDQHTTIREVEARGIQRGDEVQTDGHLDDEEGESGDEDGVRDDTPLLPIFSAAHLGSESVQSNLVSCDIYTDVDDRRFAHIQPDPRYSSPCGHEMRDNADLGPAAFPTGVTIPSQADPARNPSCTFFQSNRVRVDGQLPTIHQGDQTQSRE